MRWEILIICLIFGYLFGSIPFSSIYYRFIGKNKTPSDVEVSVDGTKEIYRVTSTGAAAASMTLGARAGCAIGILDMLKVALPTLVIKLVLSEPSYFLPTAVAGMIGHDWPVFNKFKGGRGVSSVYGAVLAIDWLGALSVAFGGLLIGLLIFRDFILAYIAGLWLIIPWMWFRYHDWWYLGFALAINVIFLLAMIPDLKQYIKFKKMGKADMDAVMLTTPMGRGMLRIMRIFRLKS